VSWGGETPITPCRLISPTVGLMPTMPLLDAGREIEPSTSAPSDTRPRLAATATAEPALEPSGLRSSTCGLRVWPPRLLQPHTARVLRM
jgi:hypothetical protein